MPESEQEAMATTIPHPRRPHPRHRRRRRNRRPAEGNHRRPRAADACSNRRCRRAEADSGAKLLQRARLARRRQLPELALSRSREAAGATPRHRAGALLLRPGRRREPDPLSARGGASASRAANASVAAVCGAEAQSTATKAERAGVTLPWTPFAHDVEEPKRGAAFQKPLAVKLGVFRPITVYPLYEAATSAHWGQTPREAMAESGAAVVDLFGGRLGKSQRLAEAAFRAGRDHDADAGQPADRVALHQADGRQPHRQHGRRDADDEPREGARGRHARGQAGLSARRRIGGRAARLSVARPVLRKPSAERGAEGGDGSGRRRRQEVRRDRAL